jgi:hypothetical protein
MHKTLITSHNYFVSVDLDGNPKLIRCSPPQGYPTVAAARKAKLKEMEDEICFYYEQINGFMNDIERGKETTAKVKTLEL